MKNICIKKIKFKPADFIVAISNSEGYEEYCTYLIDASNNDDTRLDEYKEREEIFIQGDAYHCSCYGYDDLAWDNTAYTFKELEKLCDSNYNKDNKFWLAVSAYIISVKSTYRA